MPMALLIMLKLSSRLNKHCYLYLLFENNRLGFMFDVVFSKKRGNDLTIDIPTYNFKGLKAGDKWCLCALRWLEAYNNGCAPKILLESTNIRTLDFVSLEKLLEYQV